MAHVWNNAEIEITREILSRHYDLTAAAEEASVEFGCSISRHSIQKAFQKLGMKSPANYLKKEPPPAPPPFDPIADQEARDKKKKEKREFYDIIRELRDARARLAFLDGFKGLHEPPKVFAREKKSGIRELTAVALASDWHVEELVDPVSVSARNEYNMKIAEERMKRFFNGIIWNIEHHRSDGNLQVNSLVLWLGGDLISGYIHPELVENNLLSPTEAIRWLLPHLKNGIFTVLNALDLEEMIIPCSFGNHGRTGEKPKITTGYANSYEQLMYHVLADCFSDEGRIKFEVTNSSHQYVEVYDWILHFTHGDQLRYQGGVGGLGIPLLKALPSWDQVRHADYHNIGHFHQLRDFGRAQVNGSLIGYNAYAQSIQAPFEPPQQAMYFIDSRRGKCLSTPLWVDDEPPMKGEK